MALKTLLGGWRQTPEGEQVREVTYVDDTAKALRVINVTAADAEGDGNARTATLTRVTTATTTAIAAGARAYSVTVISVNSTATPTLDGVALPLGMTISRRAPDGDTLPAASVVTVVGDDVLIDVIR